MMLLGNFRGGGRKTAPYQRPISYIEVRKKYAKKSLDVITLGFLKKRPMSGSELIELIYNEFGVFLNASSLYPILYRYNKEGLLKVEKEKKKKIYTITKKGIECLNFMLLTIKNMLKETKRL